MILFINACPRDESRTKKIADALLCKLGEYKEINVFNEDLKPFDELLLSKRDAFIRAGNYDDEMFKYARDFKDADTIVIACPFWDLSFPSAFKIYIENIYVHGLVTKFSEDGRPVGLCKANKAYYVTTSGGPYDARFSFDYLNEMFTKFFGIKECKLISADMLDVIGMNAEKIVQKTIENIEL